MGFPDTLVTFPTMMDITASDGNLIALYQQAVQAQDTETAASILAQITNYDKKIITANYLNTLGQTVNDIELFYAEKYNPAYVVSDTQPIAQEPTDFWFEITGEVT